MRGLNLLVAVDDLLPSGSGEQSDVVQLFAVLDSVFVCRHRSDLSVETAERLVQILTVGELEDIIRCSITN